MGSSLQSVRQTLPYTMPLRIALTGGIGSGKSYIAVVHEQGLYTRQLQAKRLLNEDDALRRQIIQHFGWDALHKEI